MRRSWAILLLSLLCGLWPSTGPADAQVEKDAATFGGRYRLTLTFGQSCPQRGTAVAVLLDVVEQFAQSSRTAGTEVAGRPLPAIDARLGQMVLLRRGHVLEGAFGVIYNEKVGTTDGRSVAFNLMAQGTAEDASPAARARGTAFGDLMLSLPEDEYNNALGSCTARDHTWTLERQ